MKFGVCGDKFLNLGKRGLGKRIEKNKVLVK